MSPLSSTSPRLLVLHTGSNIELVELLAQELPHAVVLVWARGPRPPELRSGIWWSHGDLSEMVAGTRRLILRCSSAPDWQPAPVDTRLLRSLMPSGDGLGPLFAGLDLLGVRRPTVPVLDPGLQAWDLARAALASKQLEAARRQVERLTATWTDWSAAWMLADEIYMALGDYTEAMSSREHTEQPPVRAWKDDFPLRRSA